ncbi:MAG: serine hydrolase [Bacteroidales bacterium]|jgi:CubicO group peptidase (beta-lactamase class C family)|nr:serine hydrolase [Bacteroidales bacterium]
MKKFLLSVAFCALVFSSFAQNEGRGRKGNYLPKISPAEAGLDPGRLTRADEVINEAIADKTIPGAVLAVVRDGRIAYLKAYGYKSVYPEKEKMTVNTVFDLASCSKVVGTTMSFMKLVEGGYVRLNDKVNRYLPDFQPYVDPDTGEKTDPKIIDLLTHTSGLPPYVNPGYLKKEYGAANPQTLLKYISTCKRVYKPRSKFVYSCLNFISLGYILEKVTGEKLCDYAQMNVFDYLGMKYTTYSPMAQHKTAIMKLVAPTEKQPDGSVLRGVVHDPLARIANNGDSGNAGVFSNAEDLSILAAALMNGGEINGRHVLGEMTVKAMFTVPEETSGLGRALGWDCNSDYSSNKGDLFSPGSTFCHTGYTGTSIVIDVKSKTAVILLAHRVHPVDKGSVVRLRALVANIVAGSIIR